MAITRADESTTYRPGLWPVGLWIGMVGIPMPIAVANIILNGLSGDALAGVLQTSILPIAMAILVFRYRMTFTADTFVYRRWGGTIRVRYRDIDHIEVMQDARISQLPMWVLLVTKRGERLRIWLKLFPLPAVRRFMHLDRTTLDGPSIRNPG
jgi:hypothetical protein